ncbi:MAG: cell division protein CrgA [Actinomycetota bacterium]|nr:cell division protein CrgA [Actinomycetota bacterium]
MPQSKSKRSRYTPPPPKKAPPSPMWVPVLMATMLLAGLVILVTNYLELLPGETPTRYTLLGLSLITCGFFVATTYR